MSSVTQREKSKFIAILDKLCLDAAEGDKSLTRKIESIDGQIKNASGTEITQLYSAVKDFFMSELKKTVINEFCPNQPPHKYFNKGWELCSANKLNWLQKQFDPRVF